ncbi:MAG: phosphoglucosamine mutase [Hadesarchaea archaeon DG-33]|nr:MAG: phosphoglucosamine mutase [Hadesarchaea archaeon DG-33]
MRKLFGTSGVRGVVGDQLTPELALDLGLALATYLGGKGSVALGKDPRTSSDMIESCVTSGLLSGGCDVMKLGVVPTPAVSFAVRQFRAKAGIMITASHNPPEYNGIKFWGSDGMAYTPEQEEAIERIYSGKQMKPTAWDRIGKVEAIDVLPGYIDEIVGTVKLKRSYKVVVDCGNGAGSVVTPYLLRKLGCKVVTLNSQLDGFFPGRGLEPSPENLGELCSVVKSIGADLGIAHDGDADRAAAVDELGRVAQPDKLLGLISAHQIRRKKEVVVTTVDASSVVDDCVAERGGKVVRTRVGDVSVATAIKKHKAVFGGEPSGAWIFPRVHLAPDGPLATIKILELLDSTGKKLSELLDMLPEYPTVREKVACPNEKKADVMKKFKIHAKREFLSVKRILTIDGVRLEFESGWVLVRPSGTEPYIRVTVEGKTPTRAKEIGRKAAKILKDAMRD